MNDHGTYARYKTEWCRCEDCRAAAAAYEYRRHNDQILGRRRTVGAIGTTRRIQALIALGWPMTKLGEQMVPPVAHTNMWKLLTKEWVLTTTAARVVDLYDRLSMTLPPQETAKQRDSVARCQARARRSGWLPPLAWDDDLIDDPTHQPARQTVQSMRRSLIKYDAFVDETAVERRLEGDKTVRLSDADRAELLRRWEASGRSLNECERFTGIAPFRTRKEMAS